MPRLANRLLALVALSVVAACAQKTEKAADTTAAAAAAVIITAGTPDKISWLKYDGSNYATSGSNTVKGEGFYEG